MASITKIEVYAEIRIGNISVETPYIQSFSVTRTRGQASTFQASLKVEHSSVSGAISGSNVRVRAGTLQGTRDVFDGMVKKATISPCWDDAGFVLLSISGTDALSNLEGKKFTRRCRQILSKWASITGIHQPAYKDAKFKYDFRKNLAQVPADMDAKNDVVATKPASIIEVSVDKASTVESKGNPSMEVVEIENPGEGNIEGGTL